MIVFLSCSTGVAFLLVITFGVAIKAGKHAVIDVAWGLGFTLIALTAFLQSADGDLPRRVLLALLTCLWGVRLALHLGRRVAAGGEDPRYMALLAKAPGNRDAYAFRIIYLTQGLIMLFVSLPIQVGMTTTGPVGWLGWAGVTLWLVGFVFETVGDRQLARFRADPANKGRVLDTGLWRYTRHPNYFGDAAVWWGLFLIAAERWPGVLTILSPVVMTYFLLAKTGKPMLERQLSSTRPGYADYIRRTSGFVPLPPKRR
ncbi:DUF1295 domain-containing protein [Nonomuraea sp. NPDC050394]|uniref:DUF1295 domain-containing protein n=1 Tax=Nonomuraea sp. NPDC050394 TaxID=3364363 RepID=UPI0037965E7A